MANALGSKELQAVLPDINRATRPFYLIYPQLEHMLQRIRVFIAFMLENLRRDSSPGLN